MKLKAEYEGLDGGLNAQSVNFEGILKRFDEAGVVKARLEARKRAIVDMTAAQASEGKKNPKGSKPDKNVENFIAAWDAHALDVTKQSTNTTKHNEQVLGERKRLEIEKKQHEDVLSSEFVSRLKNLQALRKKQAELTQTSLDKSSSAQHYQDLLTGFQRDLNTQLQLQTALDNSLPELLHLKRHNALLTSRLSQLTSSSHSSSLESQLTSLLHANVHGFHGYLKNLLKPIKPCYAPLLTTLFAKVGNYLVVSDQTASEKTSQILRENYKFQTVLVLSKLPKTDKDFYRKYRQR